MMIVPARADTIASCYGLPGEFTIDTNGVPASATVLDHSGITTSTPNSTFSGSEFCSASASYGLLRANAQLSVTGLGPGFLVATVSSNAYFTDLVTYTAPGSGNAFLNIFGAFDGVIAGVSPSTQLSAQALLELTATTSGGYALADRTVGGRFLSGQISGNCCLDEISVPIQLGTGSFSLSAHLSATVSTSAIASLSADFSNTAEITAVQLVDSNGNPLGPITLTGASGFVYPAAASGAVPEPGSPVLFGLGLTLVAVALCLRGGRLPARRRAFGGIMQRFTMLPLTLLFAAAGARAGTIFASPDLHADSTSNFVYLGTTYQAQSSVNAIDAVSSQALSGTFATPEARTAARVNGSEIAVNARLDGKQLFSQTNIDTDQSSAVYSAVLTNLGGTAQDILLNFFIPPSYVETTMNGELRQISVNPFIDAFIDVARCTSFTSCDPGTQIFMFQAFLDSTYASQTEGDVVDAPPGLDVSALRNPTITDTSDRIGPYHHTVHMGFNAYSGTLDLGTLSSGQFMQFTYTMQARVNGVAASTVGIASINDPFFFDTDPVQPGSPISISSVDVTATAPEPSAFLLAGAALTAGALMSLRRRAARR